MAVDRRITTAIALSGHLRQAAIAYAQEFGTVSVRTLERVVADRQLIGSNIVAQTLYRLNKDGLLRRVGHGVYALGPLALDLADLATPVVVAGALDKLERDYPAALAAELRRRGWNR